MGLTRLKAQQISNIDYKQAVRVVTTANVTLTGGAPNSVDGVNLVRGDRILVKAQDTASQNGLYYVSTLGTGSNGTWTRTSDGNETGEIQAGMIVMVTEGTSYKDTQWKLTTNDPIIVGTTSLTFELNVSTSAISNGNSSITIASLGANANVSIGGSSNVAVFTTTGLTANNINTDGNLVVGNNLVVNGNLTYVNVTDLNIEDPIIGLGRGPNNTPLTTDDGKDRGEQLWYYTTEELSAFIGWDDSAGKLIAAANVTIANEIVTVNSYGTLVTGSLESTGLSASGNITASNLYTNGLISATGNVIGGNILTAGQVTATSNIQGGNLITSGLISATSTITSASNITGANLRTTGTITATGNIQGGNMITTGQITATGNMVGGNVLTSGNISATGNIITAGYFVGNFAGNITGNLTVPGSNTQVLFNTDGNADAVLGLTYNKASNTLSILGLVSAQGNVTAGNVTTAGLITATGNVYGGNIETAGIITATGNITGNYILGNGSLLTGLPETYANSNVTSLLANLGSNVISSTGTITTTANISGNYFIGNGSQLTGVSSSSISYGNSNVVVNGSNGNVTIGIDGVANTVEVSPGELTVYGVYSNPKNISSNVVIGPDINSMLIGPITVDPANNIFVPTGSTLNII